MLTATIVAGLIVSALSGALIGHTDRWVRAVTGALVFVSLVLALTTVAMLTTAVMARVQLG